ncbi:cation:proton antiporter [[Clostridium] hylemonae]|uniref:Transporter, CPA2 family n=1 Tax=[Clostridium] hylemonae DSM 15053 TaxID=553973 RepID=C0BZU1_9FIRM|nr:cation:proton antiporter [[Clostridium] hylemonae]EEG74669.1 transporter, CPA2 family [[Clostridium] hylemonae DSM 15053]MCB7520382.1 cation:proton antiporter [[Clostridium] hylemonae]QEK18691.1 Na(+)/H(+)-K(+) antiporter GerN [[Clostridium] hylemonae DSM 15053]BDF05698.1 sodium:proton antiporter [[Clostridium] hylemonae]
MNSYSYLLDLAVILLCTKLLGLATRKVQMPQVVGALLAGLLLGPAVAGVLTETSFIHEVAEIGVIVLMFCAGLETDIQELKASGKASFVIALCGVLVPLAGGFGLAYFFNRPDMIASDADASIFLQNIFIGIILTATSVSITVETLKEMGKLKTRSGNAILGAAIIDDILGIIALTVVTSMADPSVHIGTVMLKIAGFFVFSGVAGFIFYKVYKAWTEGASRGLHRHVIIAFVFCLLMAYIAEEYFGVADITGAFIAGLIISNTERSVFIQTKFDTLSYMLLSPVFFASIGLKVILPKMSGMIVAFSLLLMLVAVLTKIVGCGLGAKACGYKPYQCRRIGVGMISRGEVALIVASKGSAMGLMSSAFLGPVVIMVVFTTIITPILLKIIFKKGPDLPVAKEKEVSSYYEGASILRGEEK